MLFTHRRPVDLLKKVQNEVIKEAVSRFRMSFGGYYPDKNQIGVAELRAKDIGLQAWKMEGLTVNDYNEVSNIKTDKDCYIILEGVSPIDPTITATEIQFVINGNYFPQIDITEAYAYMDAVVWLPQPIVVPPNSSFILRIYALAETVNLKILGTVVAKMGYLMR